MALRQLKQQRIKGLNVQFCQSIIKRFVPIVQPDGNVQLVKIECRFQLGAVLGLIQIAEGT
ncbi:hypothetical protein [Endozoicomonas sp. SCSIO W0465]|uniref:hypothetical protein n=1 Tax=Endozoicomonas sp. SCSIO W0465 TaxID=2918516 RepID=UPI00207646E7|nr:hypothetical protein [Endozoicomonas sp. SCSIO W0465]USE36609.1 hypothetical protein MJO57_32150 [Endozoicomonas sp. SCSIO W0465]